MVPVDVGYMSVAVFVATVPYMFQILHLFEGKVVASY